MAVVTTRICAGDIFGAMTFECDRAQTFQSLRNGGGFQVGAGNLVAEIQQHLGDATHADPADSHKVHAL